MRDNLQSKTKKHEASSQKAKAIKKPGLETRLIATMLVTRVIDDSRNLDALCDRQHGVSRFLALEERDQALARAIAVTALRHKNRIEAVLKIVMDRPPPKKARHLAHSLLVAAAQILFLDIPDNSAVDLAVTAIGNDDRTKRFRGLSNAVLRRMVREKEDLLTKSEAISVFPKWFEQTLRKDYGRVKLGQMAEIASKRSSVDLSVKSDPQRWAEILGGIVLPTGSVRLLDSKPVHTLEGFDDGEWWVQDAAASMPANLIKVNPGSRVLELCAAPGGKTAQLIHAGYDVTALDISRPRLNRLGQNLERLKMSAQLVEADILEWEPQSQFDAVLLDAPCSSTGTIRRHPDVMWVRDRNEVTELAELQFRLIKKAMDFVRTDGVFVFSNCSLFKQEGENLLARCQSELEALSLDPIYPEEIGGLSDSVNGQGAVRTLLHHSFNEENPKLGGLDGFFACRFVKK